MSETTAPLKFFVHPMTIRYYDYGDLLDTVTGICWSTDNENTIGFERGKTIADIRAKAESLGGAIEIVEGRPIARSHDMNPHGFI